MKRFILPILAAAVAGIMATSCLKDSDYENYSFYPNAVVTVKTSDLQAAKKLLRQRFGNIREENGFLRVYDVDDPEAIAGYLLENGQSIRELKKNKIGLEEYYVELMSRKEGA